MNISNKKLNKVLKSLAVAGVCLLIFTPSLSARFLWFGRKKTEKEQAVEQKTKEIKSDSPSERALASQELVDIDPQAGVDEITEALKKERDPQTKRTMLQAVGKSGNKEAALEIKQYLEDEDEGVRLYAAVALADLNDSSGIEELESVIANPDETRGRRSYSIRALGGIKSDMAVEVLSSALEDDDAAIRLQAAVSLHRIGTDEAFTALETLQDDPDEHIRETVNNLLGSREN